MNKTLRYVKSFPMIDLSPLKRHVYRAWYGWLVIFLSKSGSFYTPYGLYKINLKLIYLNAFLALRVQRFKYLIDLNVDSTVSYLSKTSLNLYETESEGSHYSIGQMTKCSAVISKIMADH
uniref:Uncharacterized protein n=1 Tax=Glossina brevipalpis TaxID=37001 RepID=A0A1A9W5R2_9MUSC